MGIHGVCKKGGLSINPHRQSLPLFLDEEPERFGAALSGGQ